MRSATPHSIADYAVSIGAVDIGTGARTVLVQIAADALAVHTADIDLAIGDTDLPMATVAGGSSGTNYWGTAITQTAQQFRADHGEHPDPGVETTATAESYPGTEGHALHSFGAVFAEARVHRLTGEIRVPRLLGVYSVGRVISPVTARSQFLGALTMGLSVGCLRSPTGTRASATSSPRTSPLTTWPPMPTCST